MKRFYQTASVGEDGTILLDGKPVKTPARRLLRAPTARLAEAIVAEWAAQGETVAPAAMPLTGMTNAACDLGPVDRERIVCHLAGYAATELLCYRDAADTPLGVAQAEAWEAALAGAEARYDVRFRRAEGIMPVAQSDETLARVAAVAAASDDFRLVALNALVGATGSLLLGLAVLERRMPAAEALRLSRFEAQFQEARWGEDAESAAAARRVAEEVGAAERFLEML